MTDREKDTVLLDYETTQKFIDKVDGQLFTIKGWALFMASGVVAYGVSQKNLMILLVNIIFVIAFCFFETMYKTFHETALVRMQMLERIIHDDMNPKYKIPVGYRFGLGHAISPVTLKAIIGILKNPNRRHLIGFYLMIIIGTVFAAIYINFIKW